MFTEVSVFVKDGVTSTWQKFDEDENIPTEFDFSQLCIRCSKSLL